MLFNHFKAFSINLNTQHVNGMTHFDYALCSRKDTMFESFLTSLIVQPGTPGIFCSVTHEKTYRAKASNKEWPIQIRSTLVAKQLLQTLFSASFICFAMKSSTSRPSVKDKLEVAAKKKTRLVSIPSSLKVDFCQMLILIYTTSCLKRSFLAIQKFKLFILVLL